MSDLNPYNPNLAGFIRAAEEYRRMYPEQRRGQAYFNALHKMYPDIAEDVRGVSQVDPFHVDAYLHNFLTFVESRLTNHS